MKKTLTTIFVVGLASFVLAQPMQAQSQNNGNSTVTNSGAGSLAVGAGEWFPAVRPSQHQLYRVLIINEKSGKVSAFQVKSAPVVTDESVTVEGRNHHQVLIVSFTTKNETIFDRDEYTVAVQAPGQGFELYPATPTKLGSAKPRSYRLLVVNELTKEVELHVVSKLPLVRDNEFSYSVSRNVSINGMAVIPMKRTVRLSREKHSLLVQPLPPRSR